MKTTYRSQAEIKQDIDNMSDEEYELFKSHIPYENRLPEHNFAEEVRNDRTGVDMRANFKSVEDKLLEHGIGIKVRNFTEFEGATQMLNRIEWELNYL